MLKKDLEIIFSDSAVHANFNKLESLYHKRLESDIDNAAYLKAMQRFKSEIAGVKSGSIYKMNQW